MEGKDKFGAKNVSRHFESDGEMQAGEAAHLGVLRVANGWPTGTNQCADAAAIASRPLWTPGKCGAVRFRKQGGKGGKSSAHACMLIL
ncbi:hypothetical protein DUNSADRAFT_4498 [Dunaliella salina]|uniref:Encoded protein n=1 Tax=Dunaliella salina TaxID=3046 RepID=A0ABQ7GRV2_DUNSA|nr:hypothetical protein DUNSADRAFT_4498 [Dunaliella salina]|eukprot:KAF5837339.1 hypothetical protein DUNSADRAFT_4498 [Dunaliella salina]